MTSGTKVIDGRVSQIPYTQTYNCSTTTKVNGSPVMIGSYWSKSWSGIDTPYGAYPYEIRVFKFRYWVNPKRKVKIGLRPDGSAYRRVFYDPPYPVLREKVRRLKVRTVPDGGWNQRFREPHPYSCNISVTDSSLYTLVEHGYCSAGWPTFAQIPAERRVLTGDSLAAYGGAIPTVGSTWTSNDDLALLGKLREEVAGSDFNLGIFLGEGREALSMIAKNATRIYRAYLAVKKGKLSKAAEELGVKPKKWSTKSKALADKWLELQYGWLPLLKDVQGGAEFLSHLFNVPVYKKYSVRRTLKRKLVPSTSSLDYGFAYGLQISSGQIVAYLSEINVAALAGLTNPAAVAWELMPFSFVADWFIPIGAYLDARGLASSLTGTFVTTRTERFVKKGAGRSRGTNEWGPAMSEWRNVYWLSGTVSVNRTVSTSLAVPLPSMKPLDKVATWRHAANAVALLTQTFGSASRLPQPRGVTGIT